MKYYRNTIPKRTCDDCGTSHLVTEMCITIGADEARSSALCRECHDKKHLTTDEIGELFDLLQDGVTEANSDRLSQILNRPVRD